MSKFITHATAAALFAFDPKPKTEMETEQDLFIACAEDLARQARHQRVTRLTGLVTSAWARLWGRLTAPARQSQARKELLDQMENMPAYMLQDIGVIRSNDGKFYFRNDFGMTEEIAPAAGRNPTSAPRAKTGASVGGLSVAHAAE